VGAFSVSPLPRRLAIASNVDFFFSCGRRHTSLRGEWSSDVCSSDLSAIRPTTLAGTVPVLVTRVVALIADDGPRPRLHGGRCNRSEERRVGNDSASRSCYCHYGREMYVLGRATSRLG